VRLGIIQGKGYALATKAMTKCRLKAFISPKSQIMAVALVTFNVADAYLTGLVLATGGTELNPLAAAYGSSILIKGLLAVAVAAAILFAGKIRWLLYLNIAVLWVVVWNLWQYVKIVVAEGSL
jgi:hypothetical protein